MRRFIPSLVLNAALPLLVYLLLRPHIGDDASALAVAAAVPVLYTIVMFLWRKRIDPVGVLAVAGYGSALAITLMSGGNPLALKLHEVVLTGPLGLACLISLLVGKPLSLLWHEFLARRRQSEVSERARRGATVVTALVGGMLVVHAVVLLFLALSMPTATYLAVSRPVGWAILAVGIGAILLYRRRLQSS